MPDYTTRSSAEETTPEWRRQAALVNFRNAGFVRGESPVARRPSAPVLIIGTLLCLLGLWILWSNVITDDVRWAALSNSGVTTQATVTGVTSEEQPTSRAGTVTVYYLNYRFSAKGPGGLSREYSDRVRVSDPDRWSEGQTVSIRYVQGDPSVSGLADEQPPVGTNLLYALIAMVPFGLGATMLIYDMGEWLKLRQMQRRGQIVPAEVTAVGAVSFYRRSGRFCSAPVTLQLRSPLTGQQVQTTQQASAASRETLPKVGDHVAVLYVSDKLFRAL